MKLSTIEKKLSSQSKLKQHDKKNFTKLPWQFTNNRLYNSKYLQPMSKSLFMIKLQEAKQTPFLLTQYHHKKNIKPKTNKIGYN